MTTETTLTRTQIGQTVRVAADYDTAISLVTDALKTEGFGVLTEIDVKATFKKKLDVDFRPYKILGACNPGFAYRSLSAAPEIGLLLPCNVTVSYVAERLTDISLVNPIAMLGVVPNPALEAIALEVAERLDRVAAALQG